MKRLFFLAGLALLSTAAFAQKIKFEGDTVMVDGAATCLMIKLKLGDGADHLMIQSLSGKDLILIKANSYNDPNQKNLKGQSANISFYVWTFVGTDKVCDTRYFTSDKKIISFILDNKLLKDDAVDLKAVDRFIMMNGTTYSDTKRGIEGPDVIIIKD